MSQEVYLTLCEGQGDERATLVDKETWDWFSDPFSEPPAAMLQRKEEIEQEYYEPPDITSGSAENDAVLYAPGIVIDGVHASWYANPGFAKDLAESFAKRHGLTIVDTFTGYIY